MKLALPHIGDRRIPPAVLASGPRPAGWTFGLSDFGKKSKNSKKYQKEKQTKQKKRDPDFRTFGTASQTIHLLFEGTSEPCVRVLLYKTYRAIDHKAETSRSAQQRMLYHQFVHAVDL